MASLDDIVKRREAALGKKAEVAEKSREPQEEPSVAASCPHCGKGIVVSLVPLPSAMTTKPAKAENTSGRHPLLEKIEKMQGSGLFEWAEPTLQGIYDGTLKFGSPTAKMEQAVKNIYTKGAEKFEDAYGEELF